MDRLKILVCIMILINLIFADETKSDSSALSLLRREKLFYSISENWIPPALTDNPMCLCAGCCLIPLTGCIVAGAHIWTQKDTVRLDTIELKQRKWRFGIGYAFGICFADKPLRKSISDWTIDPFILFGSHLHWLNSVRGSAFYLVAKKWSIEIGLEYGAVKLRNRKGLESVRISDGADSVDGWLATSDKWNLEKISLFFAVNSIIFSYGGEFTFARATTNEAIWAPVVIEKKEVARDCIGYGIFLSMKMPNSWNKNVHILPFVGGRISFANEYKNNSPWQSYWRDRLTISFTGVYAGLQFVLGGVR